MLNPSEFVSLVSELEYLVGKNIISQVEMRQIIRKKLDLSETDTLPATLYRFSPDSTASPMIDPRVTNLSTDL